jgi:hypothetical protein
MRHDMKRLVLVILTPLTACSGLDEEDIAQDSSAVITTPREGGPWGSNGTCATSIAYYVAPNGSVPSQVQTYMNNAATNWGCSYFQNWHGAYSTGNNGLGAYKWFRTSATADVGYGTYNDCGLAYWNNDSQCAYFLPARNTTCVGASCTANSRSASSSDLILAKYKNLGFENGLGMPISNPVPKSWTNTYYQLFTNGVITYHATYGAKALGGSDATDQKLALAWRDRFGAHPGATGAPPAYPLTQDTGCTARVVGSTLCASIYRTGRYTKFWDFYQNLASWIIARDGWDKAFIVDGLDASAWVQDAQTRTGYGLTPWSGGIGFPLENAQQVGTTSGRPIYNQQFEYGNIVRQPSDCNTGTNVSTVHYANAAPLTIDANIVGFCPGASIGPTCIQEDQAWVPFTIPGGGGTGQYQLICSPFAPEWPRGIRVQWSTAGQPFGPLVTIHDPVFTEWKGTLKIEQAFNAYGLPRSEEICSEATGWCAQEFDRSAMYREYGHFDVFKVNGVFFSRHEEIGGIFGCLGLPTSDSPTGAFPRTQTFVGGTITETSAGNAAVDCTTQLFDTYCWFPEVRGAKTTDIHEGITTEAYFYWNISPEGDTKSGRPPAFLGLPTTPGGMATYDNNVFGNNFQGPTLVHGDRDQWEFTSREALGGFSTRIYPLIYGQKCITVPQNANGTSTPPDGGWKNSKIREDDECWGCDDTVGYVRWNYYDLCNDVWLQGDTGWSANQRSTPENNGVSGDFEFFDYRHYCYRCRNQTTSHEECTTGVDTSWTLYGGDL